MRPEKQKKQPIILPSPMGDIKPCPVVTDPQGCFTGKHIESYEMPLTEDAE